MCYASTDYGEFGLKNCRHFKFHCSYKTYDVSIPKTNIQKLVLLTIDNDVDLFCDKNARKI